jgi:TatD DNase family protein
MDELWTPGLQGVFHCFTGTRQEAEKIIKDYKFKLGIGGVLTFKNSTLREEIKDIDCAHFLLETDAPFLAPVPYRGKRNESAYVSLLAQKLAEVKACTVEDIADITTQNARQLFFSK